MADLVVTAEAFGAIHTGFEQLYVFRANTCMVRHARNVCVIAGSD